MNTSRPWWLLLLPIAFLLHIGEELWAGEGFVAWTGRVFSSPISKAQYATMSRIGWSAFACLSLIAIIDPRAVWLAATLSTMLLANACVHALGTVATAAYSPGLVTSLLLYPPICLTAFRYCRRVTPARTFAFAVGAGVLLHALVLVATFG